MKNDNSFHHKEVTVIIVSPSVFKLSVPNMLLLFLQCLLHQDTCESLQWMWQWWPHSSKYSSAAWLFLWVASSLYTVLRKSWALMKFQTNSVHFNKFIFTHIFVFLRHPTLHAYTLHTRTHACTHTHFTSKTEPSWLQPRLNHVYKDMWAGC